MRASNAKLANIRTCQERLNAMHAQVQTKQPGQLDLLISKPVCVNLVILVFYAPNLTAVTERKNGSPCQTKRKLRCRIKISIVMTKIFNDGYKLGFAKIPK